MPTFQKSFVARGERRRTTLNKLREFDNWLLEDAFERFAHWWQKLTGKDCFWLARACLVPTVLSASIFALFSYRVPDDSGIIILASVSFLIVFVLLSCVSVLLIRKIEELVKNANKLGLSNPGKIIHFPSRLMWWLCFIVGIEIFGMFYVFGHPLIFNTAFLFTLVCYSPVSYFFSCDPLPPSREKSKIRQWLESARERLMLTPQPAGAPSS